MLHFKVSGMSCGHCVGAMTRAIKGVDTNAWVDVDLSARTVAVDGKADARAIAAAIEATGYGAEHQAG